MEDLVFLSIVLTVCSSIVRRSAIFASMIFQLIASVLMIITLEIYHGYTKGDPDQLTIIETLKNKDTAVVLLYISRFLSGWSAGKSNHLFQNRKTQIELNNIFLYIGMCCVVSTIYLMDISPRTIRGEIITFHQLFIVIGILVGQIIGIPWLLGRHK